MQKISRYFKQQVVVGKFNDILKRKDDFLCKAFLLGSQEKLSDFLAMILFLKRRKA